MATLKKKPVEFLWSRHTFLFTYLHLFHARWCLRKFGCLTFHRPTPESRIEFRMEETSTAFVKIEIAIIWPKRPIFLRRCSFSPAPAWGYAELARIVTMLENIHTHLLTLERLSYGFSPLTLEQPVPLALPLSNLFMPLYSCFHFAFADVMKDTSAFYYNICGINVSYTAKLARHDLFNITVHFQDIRDFPMASSSYSISYREFYSFQGFMNTVQWLFSLNNKLRYCMAEDRVFYSSLSELAESDITTLLDDLDDNGTAKSEEYASGGTWNCSQPINTGRVSSV